MSFRAQSRDLLLLLLTSTALLCHALFRSRRLLLRSRFRRLRLSLRFGGRCFFLWLHFFSRQLGRGKLLSVIGDLRNSHGGKWLPVSGNFFVLFLALVMEDQDFLGSTVADYLTGHKGTRFWTRNLSGAGRNREHVAELYFAILIASLGFQANHISGRHPILLSTGADDRVHSDASVVSRHISS